MKERISKLLENYNNNKHVRALLFFGFYFIFFTLIIFMTAPSKNEDINENNNKNEDVVDKWDLLDNNYEYIYEITFNNSSSKVISLEGKVYNHKNLLKKYVNNILEKEIYIFYDQIKTNEEEGFEKNNNYELVDKNFDYNLINLDYIKDIIKKSNLLNTNTNLDESITEEYLNEEDDLLITVKSSLNIISMITIKKANIIIKLQYNNINKVEDFII